MSFFQNSVLSKYIQSQDKETLQSAYHQFTAYFHNPQIQQNIREAKEEQFQEGFLRELFVNILGYTLNPQPNYNLTTELKNEKGAKKADGAILKEGSALAVIELKGTDTKDLDKINTQAFNYKNNQRNCIYVITSNFEKLRFFIHNSVEHLEFNLFNMSEQDFQLLWLCLSTDNLLNGIPLKVKEESLLVEEKVTKQLYKDYSSFRSDLWNNMIKNSSNTDQLLLFKKTQKLLDRFLFIFFAEDKGLLPPNSIIRIIEQWNKLRELDEYRPLYDRFKKYFGYLNTGWKGKEHEIFAYNGGLFLPDEVLDHVIIDDEVLHPHVMKLTGYDFQSEVDVNILGHIFENSLNEIENITAELSGLEVDKSKTKRKKDGVYYTPKYITKYIVDHTIGKLCEEKKAELGIVDEDYAKGRRNRKKDTIKKLDEQLKAYRAWLLNITICDPACGSGAFLNQALEFLMVEHAFIDELNTQLFGASIKFPYVENHILEKNLFGVDINEESVEIAKLSLWLRTAQRGRKLTTLNKNIKCGNSLIDDPAVAGDKAFHWQQEFPTVFQPKAKNAYHITWATHNSRTSQRMIDHHVKKGEALWLEPEQERIITESIADTVQQNQFNVMAYNICGDHVHLLLVCDEEELPDIIRKLKGKSSQKLKEHMQILKEESFTLWAQKFGTTHIESDEQLWNAIDYIRTNRLKHQLPPLYPTSSPSLSSSSDKGLQPLAIKPTDEYGKPLAESASATHDKGLQPLVREAGDIGDTDLPPIIRAMCCDYDHAFGLEYRGGFDVVIGNPPYLRVQGLRENFEKETKFYEQQFQSATGRFDIYVLFMEKAFQILNSKGKVSFILPHKFMVSDFGEGIRKFLVESKFVDSIVHFGSEMVFEDASTYTCIIGLSHNNTFVNFKQLKPSEILFEFPFNKIEYHTLSNERWNLQGGDPGKIFEKLKKQPLTIKDVFENISQGIVSVGDDIFLMKGKIIGDKFIGYSEKAKVEIEIEAQMVKPLLKGEDVKKYAPLNHQYYVVYPHFEKEGKTYPYDEIELQTKYPLTYNYFLPYKDELIEKKIRYKTNPTCWYSLHRSREMSLFEQEKIVTPEISLGTNMTYDENHLYHNTKCYSLVKKSSVKADYKFLLAILNSSVMWFFLKSTGYVLRGGFFTFKTKYLEPFPLPKPISEDEQKPYIERVNTIIQQTAALQQLQTTFTDLLQSKFEIDTLSKKLENWHQLSFKDFLKELQKKKVKLGLSKEAEWMAYFNEQKQKAQTLQSDIHRIDAEINQMVYQLYGLTEEEIAIVEST